MRNYLWILVGLGMVLLNACSPGSSAATSSAGVPKVVAVNSTLANIAQEIAGDRMEIDVLIPPGADPHTFQPTPRDVAKIADSQMLIANGAGLEEWLQEVIDNAGGQSMLIIAADGLTESSDRPGDPHFWLDPNFVIHYVRQIRDGFIELDPTGEAVYSQNTEQFIARLEDLDGWITQQVETISPEKRLLITNHESFGYFADRYGFVIVGTIIPSVSTGSSPTAQQMVALVEAIKATNTGAIFLEAGSNPDLAQQLAEEAGINVIVDLRTQPLFPGEGYIDMMEYNTRAIIEALR
jgi:ABC-type Zn uptake system ZnuABC Zn-binding protein ZnuA